MKEIRISDVTMRQRPSAGSFKEKIELAKLLDRLGVSTIELAPLENPKIDCLLIKSIAAAVKESTIAVPVSLSGEDAGMIAAALKEAKRPRLQVIAPVSAVQMEYLSHMKKPALRAAVESAIAACRAVCPEVEFIAEDATRGEAAFLREIVDAAIAAGATTITLSDAAGALLPDEFKAFLLALLADVPALEGVTLGVACSNALALANSCAIAALQAGAGELKAQAHGTEGIVLEDIARMLAARGEAYGLQCRVRTTSMKQILGKIAWLCGTNRAKNSPFDSGVRAVEDGIALTKHDDIAAVAAAAEKLGYDLSEEDRAKVYEAFLRIAERKEQLALSELDVIIAAAAMQVPPTYRLEHYMVNTSNVMGASAHVRLTRQDGERLEGVSLGSGPIDAAFLALEQIIGCHYELDDFQVQAVTEGRQAMGQTVVRLRSEGRLYSGRGLSTDILGASILAYINALNKIAYEEAAV